MKDSRITIKKLLNKYLRELPLPKKVLDKLEILKQEDAFHVEVCSSCNGLGFLSYNPNLNPNFFEGFSTCKCTKCNGTGYKNIYNQSGERKQSK